MKFYGVDNCWVTGKIRTSRNHTMYSSIDTRYNIRCYQDEFNRNDTTNVKGIASYHRYDISVANKPFLVSMSVWATNMNLKKIGFLILPNIHKGLKFHTEDDFFSDAKIIIEKVSQKMDDKLTKNQLCELLVNLQ